MSTHTQEACPQDKSPQYRCPLCKTPLTANQQGFSCANRHQFDRAKEGYVNLLPVQNKGSKIPGDSPEMVISRRDFLATDAYGFLQQAVAYTLKSLLDKTATVIDAGCGEGYYTNALAEQLSEGQVYGVDIAKAAVRYAAKRSKAINATKAQHFCVASNINLPFADNFADLICKIFAPVEPTEIARVLKSNGVFMTVVPGPKHLFELKQVIYEFPKEHQPEVCPAGFELVDTQSLTQTQVLSKTADIANLCQMTPFSWKIAAQKKQQLIEAGDLSITFDFVVNVYRLAQDEQTSCKLKD
ncbi:MAG: 23S rRNA (guanine(745)-N(1))-methyltransferase [Algicola sp.]|nr:23S rRNA (guanine(745)-N(1))-methyltransferase [Algicola sp.]